MATLYWTSEVNADAMLDSSNPNTNYGSETVGEVYLFDDGGSYPQKMMCFNTDWTGCPDADDITAIDIYIYAKTYTGTPMTVRACKPNNLQTFNSSTEGDAIWNDGWSSWIAPRGDDGDTIPTADYDWIANPVPTAWYSWIQTYGVQLWRGGLLGLNTQGCYLHTKENASGNAPYFKVTYEGPDTKQLFFKAI